MPSFYSEAAEALKGRYVPKFTHQPSWSQDQTLFFLLSKTGRMEAQNKIHVLHTYVYRYMYAYIHSCINTYSYA